MIRDVAWWRCRVYVRRAIVWCVCFRFCLLLLLLPLFHLFVNCNFEMGEEQKNGVCVI